MESKTVLITPEIAEDLLNRNPINRPFSASNLRFLKSQLESGDWKVTHQGIAIAENGLVLDGQHRLKAIQETGISAEMLVTTNVSESVFSVLDTGKKRSGADVLSINGATHTHCLAASIKNFILYRDNPDLVWKGPVGRVTNSRILDEYTRYQKGWQWAAKLSVNYVMPNVLLPGPFGSFLYAAMQKGHPFAVLEKFAENLKEGSALEKHHPILAFRNRCFLSSGKIQHPQGWLANYIKMFNASIVGQEMKIFKQQAYPPMPFVVKGYSP